jgi:hypothetical protein
LEVPKINESEVSFRVVVENAPTDVTFAVQLGKFELLPPTREKDQLVFEFRLRVKPGKSSQVVFLGPASHGPPQDRFVYVNSGTSAGQLDSPWTRRAKLKLGTVDRAMVEQVLQDTRLCLEGRMPAMGADGGPVCATTKLFSGWKTVGR